MPQNFGNCFRRSFMSTIDFHLNVSKVVPVDNFEASVAATANDSGCSVWECGTCGSQASSYLGSGRMTQVNRLALYTEVLGPWDGDCAVHRWKTHYRQTLD